MSIILVLSVFAGACTFQGHGAHGINLSSIRHTHVFISSRLVPTLEGWYFLQTQLQPNISFEETDQDHEIISSSFAEAPNAIFKHTTKNYYLAAFQGSNPQDTDQVVTYSWGMALMHWGAQFRPTSIVSSNKYSEQHTAEISVPSTLQIVREHAQKDRADVTLNEVFWERYVCIYI